ncbi:hypothetical protein [Bordetella sp. 02P26C-1]|uniref:hypothetical protein n=1 Tax=Bordetella sp. 02P26C-1 TaxID=2683195 RepID=UPI0013533027|nr:hypothetical protein [Bordetella sp. 02P26C-1]MVW80007.1 hypothetical protein [Bordetella sp. 02P26C-1]
MTITVQAFWDAARGTSGDILLTKDKSGLQSQYSGFLGRIVSWFRGIGAEEHRAVRDHFAAALKREYGEQVMDHPQVQAMLGGTNSDGKPLAARVVRDVTQFADTERKSRYKQQNLALAALGKGGESIEVSAPYKDLRALKQAAANFNRYIDAAGKSSRLINAMADFVNKPDSEPLKTLAGADGTAYVNFVDAFRSAGGGEDVAKAASSERLQANCAKYAPNDSPTTIRDAAQFASSQVLSELKQHCDQLLSAKPAELASVAKNTIAHTRDRQDGMFEAYRMLSKPGILEGLPQSDVALLRGLKMDLETRLLQMRNPDGPYQQLIAFAAMAVQDPSRFRSRLNPLAGGNIPIRLPRAGNENNKLLVISSSYPDLDSMKVAAGKFSRFIDFAGKKAPLVADMTNYINRPDADLLSRLRESEPSLGRFVQAFDDGLSDPRFSQAALNDTVRTNCIKLRIDPMGAAVENALVAATVQIPTRFKMLCDELIAADPQNTGFAQGKSAEILSVAAAQIATIENGIKVLSNPRVYQALPDNRLPAVSNADRAILAELKGGLEERLEQMKDPEGPFQQFIAFAAMVAQDPAGYLSSLPAATETTEI